MLVVVLLGLAFQVHTPDLHGCSWDVASPYRGLIRSDAVYVGRVVFVHRIEEDQKWTRVYEFEVSRIWKGSTFEKTYIVTSGGYPSICGSPFALGDEFLVFTDGSTSASMSNDTRRLESAQEAISELNRVRRARSPVPGTSAPNPDVLVESARDLQARTRTVAVAGVVLMVFLVVIPGVVVLVRNLAHRRRRF